MKDVWKRMRAKTPKFFRVLRNAGACLATAGGVLLAGPPGLPGWLVSMGGYLLVGGTVLTAVCQTVKESE